MKTFKILFLSILFLLFQNCEKKESDTKINRENKKETLTRSSKEKKHETNKKLVVKVEAKIKDKKFIFGEVDTSYSSGVVLFKNSFRFKYVDTDGKLVLVSFYDSDVYQAPNSFSLQLASLPQNEQTNVKVKSSKLVLKFPNKDKSMWSYNTELYEGEVQLEEFTKDKIVINFKGKGFPYGDKNSSEEFLPISGKIIIENYDVMDAR
jgi:hypothetical protein